jgi:hypothetical protein
MDNKTALASIGKMVHRTDGTPRPPARFNRKVEAWECDNYSGILREAEVKTWDNDNIHVSVETKNLGYAIFNRSSKLNTNLHLGEHPEAPADESVKNV